MTDPRPPAAGPRPLIRVLIVDDSPTAREYLTYIIDSDPDLKVIGTAANGEEALELARREKPDIITMDINMPKMNGLEATRRIMEEIPTPIIIVTASWDVREVNTTFLAMEAGALTALERPAGINDPNYEKNVKELILTIKLLSEVKVVKRWPHRKQVKDIPVVKLEKELKAEAIEVKIIAIGASTGGPLAIQTILSRLHKKFTTPILIVQHMSPGFVKGFADWLTNSSNFLVHIASHDEYPLPGHVYVAPDGFHMGVALNGRIFLSNDEADNNLRPSASFLFRSVADVYGKNSIGVLLTGMGKDGAWELKMMKDKGAITIAQDRESSIVFGMPGEAVNLQAARYVLSPEEIARTLERISEIRGE